MERLTAILRSSRSGYSFNHHQILALLSSSFGTGRARALLGTVVVPAIFVRKGND